MNFKHFLLIPFLLFPAFIFSQSDENVEDEDSSIIEKTKPTLFQSLYFENEIPKVILTTDINRLMEEKRGQDPVDARFEFSTGTQKINWDIELEPRGKSRRRICSFPPLKLKFKKEELKNNDIRKKYKNLKLVSYCKNEDEFEDYILREYLAYKMYNVLTDYSFRVQLVAIEYRDALGNIPDLERYGILIEDVDEMAERLNAKEISKYNMQRDSLNPFQYDLLALFQFMIGNTDWKIDMLHNTKIIQDKDSGERFAIPYDFDFSGFVNTDYAIPNFDYHQKKITDRIYLGECTTMAELDTIRQVFLSKKTAILHSKTSAISRKEYKKMMHFIRPFFHIIKREKRFIKKCLDTKVSKSA